MKTLLLIEAVTDAVIDKRRKVPDPGLMEAAVVIEANLLPGGPISYGGTLKVAAPDSLCQRCQCRMGRHWTHDARCRDCGCKGWLAA